MPIPSLIPRVLAAVAMIAGALGAAWHGPIALSVLTCGAGLLMANEWSKMAHGAVFSQPFWFAVIGLWASQSLLLFQMPEAAIGAVFGAALLANIAERAQGRPSGMTVLGILYVLLPCVGLVWLRGLPIAGLETVLWLFAVVWTTDSAAFAFGRWIGGPKLAPQISPQKTWSGALGGLLVATAVSYAFALIANAPSPWLVLVLGGIASVVGQLGDLFESALKRHFNVKNSSSLIPGHGGVLDRLDGFIAAVIFVCILTIWRNESPLVWDKLLP